VAVIHPLDKGGFFPFLGAAGLGGSLLSEEEKYYKNKSSSTDKDLSKDWIYASRVLE